MRSMQSGLRGSSRRWGAAGGCAAQGGRRCAAGCALCRGSFGRFSELLAKARRREGCEWGRSTQGSLQPTKAVPPWVS